VKCDGQIKILRSELGSICLATSGLPASLLWYSYIHSHTLENDLSSAKTSKLASKTILRGMAGLTCNQLGEKWCYKITCFWDNSQEKNTLKEVTTLLRGSDFKPLD